MRSPAGSVGLASLVAVSPLRWRRVTAAVAGGTCGCWELRGPAGGLAAPAKRPELRDALLPRAAQAVPAGECVAASPTAAGGREAQALRQAESPVPQLSGAPPHRRGAATSAVARPSRCVVEERRHTAEKSNPPPTHHPGEGSSEPRAACARTVTEASRNCADFAQQLCSPCQLCATLPPSHTGHLRHGLRQLTAQTKRTAARGPPLLARSRAPEETYLYRFVQQLVARRSRLAAGGGDTRGEAACASAPIPIRTGDPRLDPHPARPAALAHADPRGRRGAPAPRCRADSACAASCSSGA